MKKKNLTADLTVVVGPMFSGKSSTLREHMVRHAIAGMTVQVFKPIIDDRGEGNDVVKTHSDSKIAATSVRSPKEILRKLTPGVEVVGIDEAQFFDKTLVEVVLKLRDSIGVKVIVAGLPSDFRGEPFGTMPQLLSLADDITHCKAVCTFRDHKRGSICGKAATRTQRMIDGKPAKFRSPIIVVGGKELYEARCIKHHVVPGKKI